MAKEQNYPFGKTAPRQAWHVQQRQPSSETDGGTAGETRGIPQNITRRYKIFTINCNAARDPEFKEQRRKRSLGNDTQLPSSTFSQSPEEGREAGRNAPAAIIYLPSRAFNQLLAQYFTKNINTFNPVKLGRKRNKRCFREQLPLRHPSPDLYPSGNASEQ